MKNHFNIVLRIFIFILGIFISFNLIYSTQQVPRTLFLIPLIYSLLIMVFPSITKYMFSYLGLLALNITMLLRYLISPLLISINGIQVIGAMYPLEISYTTGINLMLYEIIVIFIVFQLLHKRFYNMDSINKIEITRKPNVTGWLFILFCIGIVIIYPEILGRYSFVLTTNELKSKDFGIDIISFLPLLFQLATLVLTISLINIVYIRYKSNPKFIQVISALMITIIISSFIIGTSRFSVVLPLITGLYIIYLLFSKYRRPVIMISVISVVFIILSTSVLKASTIYSGNSTLNSFFNELNSNLQLYFSGVTNVAISVQTNYIYNSFNVESILSDLFRSVVLINSIFHGSSSALIDFNVTFYNGGLARDQILPMIGQGYLYFGFMLAPIFSVSALIILMYFDSKVMSSHKLMYKFIYVYTSLKLGLFMMTNFTNLLSFLTNYFFVLFLIFYVNDKFVRQQSEVQYEYQ